MTEAVVTLATVPAILALVNLAKSFGVTGKWSALLAVILGVGITAAYHYVDSTVMEWVTSGTLLGLAAAGLYDLTPGGYTPQRAADPVP